MKILPLQFEDIYTGENGQTQSNKDPLQDPNQASFNLHEMFDVYDSVGDEVPDIEGCDLFCPESLSDELDHNVPFSSISSISSQDPDEVFGGVIYPLLSVTRASTAVFNDSEDDLNRRISDEELSQSESDTEDVQMENQVEVGRADLNTALWNQPNVVDVLNHNVAQNRDRLVPDVNELIYDSDEERILNSTCSDLDHVVPNFYMEE